MKQQTVKTRKKNKFFIKTESSISDENGEENDGL